MNRIKTIFIIVGLQVVSWAEPVLPTQPANSYTIQQAVDYGIKNSAQFQNSELESYLALYKKNEVRGIGFPQISATADMKNFLSPPSMPNPSFGAPGAPKYTTSFSKKINSSVGISASQIIFSSDYIVALQTSKIYLELSKKDIERSKIEVSHAVRKAYYSVLTSREKLKFLVANIDKMQNLYNETSVLNESGFVEKMDVEILEVTLNNLKTERDKIVPLIQLSEDILKFQMGMHPDSSIILTDSILPTEQFFATALNDTLHPVEKPEMSLLKTQMKLNEMQLMRDNLSFLPTLAAFGSWSENYQSNDLSDFGNSYDWRPTKVIGLSLSIPIFSGTQRYYRIQQSKVNLRKVENSLRMLEHATALEINSTTTQLSNALKSLQNQKRNQELANRIYETAIAKYKNGVGSHLEVVSAETSLKESQTNYINSLYDCLIYQLDLKKSLGKAE